MAGELLLGLVGGQVGPMYCLGVSPEEQDGGEMVTVDLPSTAVCYATLAEFKTQERKEQSPFPRKRRVKRKAVVFHSEIDPQLGSDT